MKIERHSPSVFIGYAWDDEPKAIRVANELKERNLDTLLFSQITPFTTRKTIDTIKNSDFAILLFSTKSHNSSSFTLIERICWTIQFGLIDSKTAIIPLLLEGDNIPSRWAEVIFFNCSGDCNFENTVEQIIKIINGEILISKPQGRNFKRLVLEALAFPEELINEFAEFTEKLEPGVYLEDEKDATSDRYLSRNIFIVHGHEEAPRESVARVLEKLGLNPIILREKPTVGKTIIEKVEKYSDVGFAVVLLTPDDVGYLKHKPNESMERARQNVIFELGYFIGHLGRGRVCLLKKGKVEIPSDYHGVVYIEMDSKGAWKLELAKELEEAGIEVDLNKLKT
ncbi:hypothetical protein ES703_00858 [subsurface metagenome]|nr:TIR domain-containing protein [bacterium]